MKTRLLLPGALLTIGLAVTTLFANAQSGFFEPASPAQARTAAPAADNIQKFLTYRLRDAEMRSYLAKAPLEFTPNSKALRLEIPLPNGTVEPFAMLESPILAPAIAAQHPDIKTYTGRGLTHPAYTIRLSFTGSGFDAIILGVEGDAVYYTKAVANDPADRTYLTYFARNVKKNDEPQPFGTLNKCGISDEGAGVIPEKTDKQGRLGSALNNTGATLRTFRLAVAATGEFTQKRGGTVSAAFNSLVGYVNRMNAVYRTELSVAFVLVTGDNLVYPNALTDPYTNSSTSAMLDENQANLDQANVVGSANYDIGHVFGYAGSSGGGIAQKGSVCVDGGKARGVSNVGNTNYGPTEPNFVPYAPVFDDQLISHEVGHQFDMSHSFNSSISVCTTRAPTTSVEPGSGATIMSYGFTCGGQSGDDYEPGYQPFLNFHTVNYQQAATFINTLTCFTSTALNNAVPVIGTFPANTTVPKSTPFELAGAATDANAGDVLSYQWEGTNIGLIVPTPDSKTVVGNSTLLDTAQPPFFRSYVPVSTGTRTFPRLSAIVDGTNTARGDKLPSVGIATTHRLTVRDNAGGLTYREATVTVDGNSGPFLETTNLSGVYQGNSMQTITWSVNNTNQAPVSCALVNILLSTDGGLTFPTTLLANTPNDGTEPVTLPLVSANQARIKVMAVGNIFFDISNANFTIINPANQPPVAVAIPDQTGTLDAPFMATLPAFTDPENQPLTYTALGLPTSLTLNPTTRVISGTPGSVGVFSVTVVATDPGNATATAAFTLTLNGIPLVPLLVSTTTTATTFPVTTGTISVTTTVSGGRPPYRYDYSANRSLAGNSGRFANYITFTDVNAGVQSLSVVVVDSSQPVNQTTTATISVTVTTPGAVPIVQVNSTDPNAAEGRPNATQSIDGLQAKLSGTLSVTPSTANDDPGFIRFVRSSGAGTLVVNYQIGGTATNGVDFLSLPTSVTFLPGQTEYIEEMDPIDDDIVEGDETVIITLVDEAGYDLDPNETTTTLTIKDAPPTVAPAGSLTITNFSCNTTNAGLSSVSFVVGYTNGTFIPAVAPLLIVGVTGNGQLGQSYTFAGFDANVSTLNVQDQASRSTYFVWNFRQACSTTPQPPITPNSLTITSFTCNTTSAGLSSVSFVVGYPGGVFTPAVAPLLIVGVTGSGQLGQSYTFAGFDTNVNTLTVQDQASRSTYFVWNFRTACASRTARQGVEADAPWQVSLLGNPTSSEVSLLIEGAPGQALTIDLLTITGRTITTRQIQPVTARHHEVFNVAGQPAGLLLLRTTSDTHSQTLKVIKE